MICTGNAEYATHLSELRRSEQSVAGVSPDLREPEDRDRRRLAQSEGLSLRGAIRSDRRRDRRHLRPVFQSSPARSRIGGCYQLKEPKHGSYVFTATVSFERGEKGITRCSTAASLRHRRRKSLAPIRPGAGEGRCAHRLGVLCCRGCRRHVGLCALVHAAAIPRGLDERGASHQVVRLLCCRMGVPSPLATICRASTDGLLGGCVLVLAIGWVCVSEESGSSCCQEHYLLWLLGAALLLVLLMLLCLYAQTTVVRWWQDADSAGFTALQTALW